MVGSWGFAALRGFALLIPTDRLRGGVGILQSKCAKSSLQGLVGFFFFKLNLSFIKIILD